MRNKDGKIVFKVSDAVNSYYNIERDFRQTVMVSIKSNDQSIHPFLTALVQPADEFCKGTLSFLP